jgi:hypothetical protein
MGANLSSAFTASQSHPGLKPLAFPSGAGIIREMPARILLALLLPLLPAAPVKTGLEVLVRDGFKPLQGKRVGLVTNHSGLDASKISTVDILAAGKGFTLTTLFSFQSGICSGSINKCNNGLIKLLRHFHEAKGFAVTLRICHTEIPELALFGSVALLLANEHNCFSINGTKAANDCLIILYCAVAKKFEEGSVCYGLNIT